MNASRSPALPERSAAQAGPKRQAVVICASPLLEEIVLSALAHCDTLNVTGVPPERGEAAVANCSPDVIILDRGLPAADLEAILQASRAQPHSRVIILDPQGNDVVVVESRLNVIHTTDDLLQVVQKAED